MAGVWTSAMSGHLRVPNALALGNAVELKPIHGRVDWGKPRGFVGYARIMTDLRWVQRTFDPLI